MNLAIDDGTRTGSSRPWARRAAELEPEHGPWSDYAAWQQWFFEREESHNSPYIEGNPLGFHPAPIRECLEYDSEIMLYILMCELADRQMPAEIGATS